MGYRGIYDVSLLLLKLSGKSASAAKLFNSVHKAQVSWKRIRPLLAPVEEAPETAVKIQK